MKEFLVGLFVFIGFIVAVSYIDFKPAKPAKSEQTIRIESVLELIDNGTNIVALQPAFMEIIANAKNKGLCTTTLLSSNINVRELFKKNCQ